MNEGQLNALLRADAAEAVADDGFTQRLLQRLPARRRVRARSGLPTPARAAQTAALSLAVLTLGLLPASAEAMLPAACLVALVLWWSLPQSAAALFRGG